MMAELNWIDWLVLGIVAYVVYDNRGRGFISQILELFGFVGALWVALKTYAQVGNFVAEKFGSPPGWAKLGGFVFMAAISELVLSEVIVRAYRKMPHKFVESKSNKWLGVVPAAINGFLIVSFFLLLVLALPLRGTVKSDIRESLVGGNLVVAARKIESGAFSIFEEAINETAKFFTINPGSRERVSLDYEVAPSELKTDEAAEAALLTLVNQEREKLGVRPLVMDGVIVEVARKHSRDMFERQYFAHINPDGKDPFDRMREGGVSFTTAGENLALAPSVSLAHQGLMDSEGHKRNILDPNFGRVGIGVIDGGIYGKMFTQNFAD